MIVCASVYVNSDIQQAHVEYDFRPGQFRLGLTGMLLADSRTTYNQAMLAGASLAPLSNTAVLQLPESLDSETLEDIREHAWQLGLHLVIRMGDDVASSKF